MMQGISWSSVSNLGGGRAPCLVVWLLVTLAGCWSLQDQSLVQKSGTSTEQHDGHELLEPHRLLLATGGRMVEATKCTYGEGTCKLNMYYLYHLGVPTQPTEGQRCVQCLGSKVHALQPTGMCARKPHARTTSVNPAVVAHAYIQLQTLCSLGITLASPLTLQCLEMSTAALHCPELLSSLLQRLAAGAQHDGAVRGVQQQRGRLHHLRSLLLGGRQL
jgi:hypothetical protein